MMIQRIDTECQELFNKWRYDIANSILTCTFTTSTTDFIPRKAIQTIALKENILQALCYEKSVIKLEDTDRSALAEEIAQDCPKLFVLCIAQRSLSVLLLHVDDETEKSQSIIALTDARLPMKHDTIFDDAGSLSLFVYQILPLQHRVLCPVSVEGQFDQEIKNLAPIPTKVGEPLGSGGKRNVYPIFVHEDHCPFTRMGSQDEDRIRPQS
jgi:hypothetical protein